MITIMLNYAAYVYDPHYADYVPGATTIMFVMINIGMIAMTRAMMLTIVLNMRTYYDAYAHAYDFAYYGAYCCAYYGCTRVCFIWSL